MYKLVVSDNFNSREYSIKKRRGITALAMEYGRGKDKLILYNYKGKSVDACKWDVEKQKYTRRGI